MVKLVALFGLTFALVAAGGYFQKNPEAVVKLRQYIPQGQLGGMTPFGPTLATPAIYDGGKYTLKVPAGWHLESSVPGCGPVWFAPETQKVWMTVCEQTEGEIFSGEWISMGDNRVQTLEKPYPEGKYFLVKFENGFMASLAIFTPEAKNYRQAFETLVGTVEFKN